MRVTDEHGSWGWGSPIAVPSANEGRGSDEHPKHREVLHSGG